MNRPQSILIFLPDGSPRSARIAEITNRVVKAVLIPRNKLEYVGERDEVKNVGLYLLFGESEERAKPMVYIGEAEDCYARLKEYHREKDFWNHAVVLVSKINAFTKAHVKYLEHLAIRTANEVKRFEAANGNAPSMPYIPEHMEADLLDSFETMKILLSTLGYPVFDPVSRQEVPKQALLYAEGRGVKAEGNLVNDCFVVYKGSEMANNATPSCHDYLLTIRNKLISEGIVKQEGHPYTFQENYIFSSPSTAAAVVLGRNTNGWVGWKNSKGQTLDELERRN